MSRTSQQGYDYYGPALYSKRVLSSALSVARGFSVAAVLATTSGEFSDEPFVCILLSYRAAVIDMRTLYTASQVIHNLLVSHRAVVSREEWLQDCLHTRIHL